MSLPISAVPRARKVMLGRGEVFFFSLPLPSSSVTGVDQVAGLVERKERKADATAGSDSFLLRHGNYRGAMQCNQCSYQSIFLRVWLGRGEAGKQASGNRKSAADVGDADDAKGTDVVKTDVCGEERGGGRDADRNEKKKKNS